MYLKADYARVCWFTDQNDRQKWLEIICICIDTIKVLHGIAAAAHRRDANDNTFIHAAISAEATLLVTGDQDLLVLAKSLKDSYKLVICKPAYALALNKAVTAYKLGFICRQDRKSVV